MRLKPSQIERWVDRHFEYRPKSKNNQLAINNPFDGDDGWHFWISLIPAQRKEKGRPVGAPNFWVHDFRPGHQQWDGSFIKFVQSYKGINYYAALKDVCGNATDAKLILQDLRNAEPEKDPEDVEPEEKFLELPRGSKPILDGSGKIHEIATSYLKRRCILPEIIKSNFLHYTATSIVFPYLEYGMMVYWQERSVVDKIFHFPNGEETGLSKTDFLYGFDNVEPGQPISITEAIIDSLSIGDNSCATGGADMSERQVRKIKALNPEEIILAPDNDKAGVISLRKSMRLLRPHFNPVLYCFPPKYKDLKDWNAFDQEFGPGWSNEYINNNSRRLDKRTLLVPWIRNGV